MAILFKVMLSVTADWQLEVRLLSYNNPRGFTENMECCDAAISPGVCLPQETCDTEIVVRIVNFDRLLRQLGSTLLVGIYEDSDQITFPACGTLAGDQPNPLVITFPRSEFSVGVSLKFSIEATALLAVVVV